MKKILQLYGGRLVNPKDLSINDINIESIAHSLSNQCRFCGHCKYFYSVAQHSVYVSNLAPLEHKLCALLHDATETFLVDVPSGIKQESEFADYRALEKIVWLSIAQKFNIGVNIPDIIKRIDKAVLWYEVATLMRNADNILNDHWYNYSKYAIEFPIVTIDRMSPEEAKDLFLSTFNAIIK